MASDASNIPKFDDQQRIQRLVDETNARNAAKRIGVYDLEPPAKAMMIEYANELTKSLIASSSTLAAHRGSKMIEEKDILLVLGKLHIVLNGLIK
jgi:histone H3/H4